MIIRRIKRVIIHMKELVARYIAIHNFCKENKRNWENNQSGESNIYIAYTLHGMCEFLYESLLFAKGMEEASKCKVIALTSERESLFRKMCKSFHVNYILLYKFSLYHLAKLVCETVKMCKKISSGIDLLNYQYKNIHIGPSVYDTILVKTGKCTYEGEKSFKVLKIFLKGILLVDQLTDIFSHNSCSVCIVMEEAYEAEIYRRVAKEYGGKIIWVNKMLKEYRDQDSKITTYYDNALKREIGEKLDETRKKYDYVGEVDRQLFNYYRDGNIEGIKGRVLSGEAVRDKITKTKEDVIDELGLDVNKKNVLVFSHCMTDGPHACYKLLYQDYFVWLKRTLEIASNVKDVNWIVKFHPDRFRRFGEKKDTELIREKFEKVDNIYFFPDNYSLLSAQELADVIITARGKVGEEMSCYGIPIITAGCPCYSVWGYTYTFNEVSEYERCLSEIDKIGKLDSEKIDMAKCVFYAHSLSTNNILDDDFGAEIDKSTQARKNGNSSSRVIDTSFLRKMSSNNMIEMMKKSQVYKTGFCYATESK